MRTERLRQLADHIESLKKRPISKVHLDPGRLFVEKPTAFNMGKWAHKSDCGTVACIAGHAVSLFRPSKWPIPVRDIESVAADLLDIPWANACLLFTPTAPEALRQITPKQAAQVLRMVADGDDAAGAWSEVLSDRDLE